MAAKLGARRDPTVVVAVKMPRSLKRRLVEVARASGDGDFASWVRRAIHERWTALHAGASAQKAGDGEGMAPEPSDAE